MSSLTKALVTFIDETVLRPLVWALTWSPDIKRKAHYWIEDFWEEED